MNPIIRRKILKSIVGIVFPPPPYIIATDGSSNVTNISGLSYVGVGPSSPSTTFNIMWAGLSPTSGNITVTVSSNFEVFDGSTWNSTSFNIPYTTTNGQTSTIY